jgi:ABC-2 type transport system permease protein
MPSAKRFIRVLGFTGKEVREIIRQPRLLLSLLLGPFLILLLFGVGYVSTFPPLRAILVIPNDPSFTNRREELREQFSANKNVMNIQDVTVDLPDAQRRLRNGEADVVIAVPANVAQQIGSGAQAIIPVYYTEVDPVGAGRIEVGTLNYTNDLNKETVVAAFRRGQAGAGDVREALSRLDAALGRISDSIATGDVQKAGQEAPEVRTNADMVLLGAGLMIQLLQSTPMTGTTTVQQQNLAESQNTIRNMNNDVQALQTELEQPNPDPQRVRDHTEAVRRDVREMQGLTAQFQQINPYVLAAPFFGQAQNLSGTPTFLNFYTPGVIALLLQHIAVTLGALSIVRERMRGSFEIFRFAPISPGEILTGKYLGFILFLAVLAAALIALAVGKVTVGGTTYSALGIPMLGDYFWLAGMLLLLIFASLGLGFGISMISKTESQAVQLAMLTLLTSVFFSGFFLPLSSFWEPVRALSYSLPVTHGILSLQDIMLRGREPNLLYPLALIGLGFVFAAFAMWRFSREFRRG